MKSKSIAFITSLLVVFTIIFTPLHLAFEEKKKKKTSEETEIKDEENKEIQTEKYGEPPSGANIKSEQKEVEIDIDTPASVTGEVMNGTGTVVDFTTTGSKAFYTIVDNEQKVFYLIIDMDKPTDNVYFLQEINRSELESSNTTTNVDNNTPPNTVEIEQDVESTTSNNKDQADDNNLKFLMMVLLLGGIGVVGYYFFVIRKKKDKNQDTQQENDDEILEDYDDDFEEDFDYAEENNDTDKQT